jgi:hypothetical protein
MRHQAGHDNTLREAIFCKYEKIDMIVVERKRPEQASGWYHNAT